MTFRENNMEFHHTSIMLPEVLEGLHIRENGIYQGKTEAGSHDGGIGS